MPCKKKEKKKSAKMKKTQKRNIFLKRKFAAVAIVDSFVPLVARVKHHKT